MTPPKRKQETKRHEWLQYTKGDFSVALPEELRVWALICRYTSALKDEWPSLMTNMIDHGKAASRKSSTCVLESCNSSDEKLCKLNNFPLCRPCDDENGHVDRFGKHEAAASCLRRWAPTHTGVTRVRKRREEENRQVTVPKSAGSVCVQSEVFLRAQGTKSGWTGNGSCVRFFLVQGYLAIRRGGIDGEEVSLARIRQRERVLSKTAILVLRLPAIWRPCVSGRKTKLKRLAED